MPSSFNRADEVETSSTSGRCNWALSGWSWRKAQNPNTLPLNDGSEPINVAHALVTGVFGYPTAATAKKGERLLFGVTAECMKQVRPFAHSLNLSLS